MQMTGSLLYPFILNTEICSNYLQVVLNTQVAGTAMNWGVCMSVCKHVQEREREREKVTIMHSAEKMRFI